MKTWDNVHLQASALQYAKEVVNNNPSMKFDHASVMTGFRAGAKWAVSRDRLLEAFANALGVESAEGWKTGQAIMKELGLGNDLP